MKDASDRKPIELSLDEDAVAPVVLTQTLGHAWGHGRLVVLNVAMGREAILKFTSPSDYVNSYWFVKTLVSGLYGLALSLLIAVSSIFPGGGIPVNPLWVALASGTALVVGLVGYVIADERQSRMENRYNDEMDTLISQEIEGGRMVDIGKIGPYAKIANDIEFARLDIRDALDSMGQIGSPIGKGEIDKAKTALFLLMKTPGPNPEYAEFASSKDEDPSIIELGSIYRKSQLLKEVLDASSKNAMKELENKRLLVVAQSKVKNLRKEVNA